MVIFRMTVEEFNNKYKDCLEERHYGLAIENPYVITLLDLLFQNSLKIRNLHTLR